LVIERACLESAFPAGKLGLADAAWDTGFERLFTFNDLSFTPFRLNYCAEWLTPQGRQKTLEKAGLRFI
jgi:hypothetical protein